MYLITKSCEIPCAFKCFFLAYPHVRGLSTIEWGFPMALHVARLGPQASVLENLRGTVSMELFLDKFTITIHKRGYHWM